MEVLGDTDGLGQHSVLVRLSLQIKIREAVVCIAAAGIEGKRSVVVNPWRKPEHRCPGGSSKGFSAYQQLRTNFSSGERFLNIQPQQFCLSAGWRKRVTRRECDLSEADHVVRVLGNNEACSMMIDGRTEYGLRVRIHDFARYLRPDALSGVGVQEYLRGKH